MAERLGSRQDRHRGLLFVRLEGERKGGVQKDYFTVRDRTGTDQGRHGPGRRLGSVPGGSVDGLTG
ncbi:hypothetical protein C5746_11635 [Streptomyces atratus]|uniref:Uncharacterized protein n=1 Tax=Streptomyces atratus TaxID=1893 RepID=A0A2Z5JAX7_STRAR|nr:hypothetical protein C5746_11635 [Streptomyces atratus]